MTEVLFGLSVAFVGYVAYVLVDEQITAQQQARNAVLAQPETSNMVEIAFDRPLPIAIPSEFEMPDHDSRVTIADDLATETAVRQHAPIDVAATTTNTLTMPELIGFAAGSVYRYLDQHGATSVTKLLRAVPEESKLVQRAIGWLAQEGKINLNSLGRTETLELRY